MAYRHYTQEQLDKAYKLSQGGMTVYKAEKLTGVPRQTLTDRACGHVDPYKYKSGPDTLFDEAQEKVLSEHIMLMPSYGYGNSRQEVLNIAVDTAIHLGLRRKVDKDGNSTHLSKNWLDVFLKRNPSLNVRKPQSLSQARAKALSKPVVEKYFIELKAIIDKYQLHDKPHYIFNIDETGITTEHKPPKVVSSAQSNAQSITSPRGSLTTVISCTSASGQVLPPYFVFKGKRAIPELLEKAMPGTKMTMSDSGWSNGRIFQQFLTEHFLQHIPQLATEEHMFLLYDGHKSHISFSLVSWALERNIILFVLPAHTSHALQPLDVGCFGPLKRAYNAECQNFLRTNIGRAISRYDVCSLLCKAYGKTMTPANAIASFKTTGIYPFNSEIISDSQFSYNARYLSNDNEPEEAANVISENSKHESPNRVSLFLATKIPKFVPPFKKNKRSVDADVDGKAITESKTNSTKTFKQSSQNF